jgi:hypothetical protein
MHLDDMPSGTNLWHIYKANYQIRTRIGPFVAEYSKAARDNKQKH